MNPKYIIALDQGTTSSRAIAFNKKGEIQHVAQKAFEQIFPQSGWVEHNPNEIWESQKSVLADVLSKLSIDDGVAEAIGITNQRETVVMWDRKTGNPLYNAIVWQDRRTAAFCDELKGKGLTEKIKRKTGLILDAYFSGTKAKWLLDNVPGAREKANAGDICLGTIDTWLIYKLTGGESFVTDVSNASRTLLFDIHSLSWDDELLALFDVPRQCLPKVCASSEIYAHTKREVVGYEIPIAGIAGDQQAALFGQMCTQPGMLKNTYGTGCFLLMNTGEKAVYSNNNLLTTVAWKIGDTTHYALEGSVFVGGAAVQWIRDGLELIKDAREIEDMATAVPDNGGVYFVPALTGLGAPHWDPYARGAIVGLSRGTTKNHIARATLEGITYQVYDLVKAMEADAGQESKQLRVDGGAVANNFMMQFQANLFGFDVVRPQVLETTALGAAYLAGLAVGFWSMDELSKQWSIDKTFERNVPKEESENLLSGWNNALPRAKNWIQKTKS